MLIVFLILLFGVCYSIYHIVNYISFRSTIYAAVSGNGYWDVVRNKGTKGEFRTFKMVDNPSSKFLFNAYIPKSNGSTTEIDMLMLHPTGIYVFECKNYGGTVYGTGLSKYWTQYIGKEMHDFFSPIFQNDFHIRGLKSYLGSVNVPVYSVVCFCGNGTLKVSNIQSDVFVGDIYETRRFILNSISQKQPVLSENALQDYYEKLSLCTRVSEEIKWKHINKAK